MSAWARRWQSWFLVVSLAVLVAGGLYAPLPYFVEAPGRLLTLGGCVRVDAEDTVPVRGDYLLTTVGLRRARPFGLVRAAMVADERVRPDERVVRSERSDADHFASQRRVFAESARRAAALGLREAGFGADPERYIGDGALVTGVLDDSPAEGVLRGGDVIVAVDGVPVATDVEVRAFLEDPDPVVVRFTRGGTAHEVQLSPHPLSVDGEERLLLGLRLTTLNSRIDLPVPVHVQAGKIGGPSAALMIALAVYDQSDPSVDLAAGRRIAGTGTLTSHGAVGRIGGIDLKALGASERGADVFLAPESQAEEALASLPEHTDLEILPVATFEGAVRLLLETADPSQVEGGGGPSPDCPVPPAA